MKKFTIYLIGIAIILALTMAARPAEAMEREVWSRLNRLQKTFWAEAWMNGYIDGWFASIKVYADNPRASAKLYVEALRAAGGPAIDDIVAGINYAFAGTRAGMFANSGEFAGLEPMAAQDIACVIMARFIAKGNRKIKERGIE